MKICINGLSMEQYKNTSSFEEFYIYLESLDYMSDREIQEYLDSDYDTVAMEDDSLIKDMVKGAYKGTKYAVKTGVKAYKTANKEWGRAKNKWVIMKPKIMKLVRDFGQTLQNVWHKYMQYDQKYKELGQKIQQIIQFSIKAVTDLPAIELYWHNFNVELLKDLLDILKDYGSFFDKVLSPDAKMFNASSLLSKGTAGFSQLADLITSNNVEGLKFEVNELSQTLAKLSVDGDITILRNIMNLKRYQNTIMGWLLNQKVENLLDENAMERFKGKNISGSEFVKACILGVEMHNTYSNQNIGTFRDEMVNGSKGKPGFLTLVASMLNNNVLSGALKSSGATTKKQTDLLIKFFNDSMKEAETHAADMAKEKEAADQKAQKEAEESKRESQLKSNSAKPVDEETGMPQGPEYKSLSEDSDVNEEDTSADDISSLTEYLVRNMTLMFTKISTSYQQLMKGILAATYQIISEADAAVSVIESAVKVPNRKVE